MVCDLQKANMWKRVSAWLFDTILLAVAAVGCAFLISALTGYDNYNDRLQATYDRYEAEYQITLDISEEEYLALGEEERAAYDAAYVALNADEEAIYVYHMVIYLTLLMLSLGLLFAYMLLEFIVPLLIGQGQTLGKRIFGIALMRVDGVKMSVPALLVRTLLGKYTVETMVPALIVIMIYFHIVGIAGTVALLGLLILQIVVLAVTKTNATIHDLLAGTVAVDKASQRIFDTEEALLAYKQKIAAEAASRSEY